MSNLVVVARPTRMRLEEYLNSHKIEYKFIAIERVPDGTPCGCTFRGHTFLGPGEVFAVESGLTKNEIYDILYEIVPGAAKYRESDGN